MSDLAELTGKKAENASVLPGYIFSRWGLKEIADAERAFERDHIACVCDGVAAASASVRDAAIENAHSLVALGIFNYGSSGFTMKLYARHLTPLLLKLSLRKTQPQMTDEAAETLLSIDNQGQVIGAIRDAAGLTPKPSPNVAGAGTPPSNPAPPSATA